MRQNTDEHARVMSWWDYGYQIAGMANRTTLVDNNTWNNSHIALVRLSRFVPWLILVFISLFSFCFTHWIHAQREKQMLSCSSNWMNSRLSFFVLELPHCIKPLSSKTNNLVCLNVSLFHLDWREMSVNCCHALGLIYFFFFCLCCHM